MVIQMNRLWLKLIGCIAVVFAVIVVGYVFWPAGTADKDSQKDFQQVPETIVGLRS
jgi:hypothetical protein